MFFLSPDMGLDVRSQMSRPFHDVLEKIMESGPAPGDWQEFEHGSIVQTTKETGEDEWRCQRCDYSYDSKEKAVEHIRNSVNHILCLQCPHLPEFKTMRNLYMHMHRRHSLCLICGVFFPSVKLFHQHMASHPRCKRCQKYFFDIDEFSQHYFNHSKFRMKCPRLDCDYHATSYAHMFKHLEDEERVGGMFLGLKPVYSIWAECSKQEYFDWVKLPSIYGLGWRNYRCTGCFTVLRDLPALVEHIELNDCPHVPERHWTSLKLFLIHVYIWMREWEERGPIELMSEESEESEGSE